jgi:hypothetical protein
MYTDVVEKPSLEILLTTDLINLINRTASQFYRIHGKKSIHSAMITQEDLAQQGFYATIVAYDSFNPDLCVNDDLAIAFRTHAFLYIRDAMSTYCRKFGHTLSISNHAARDNGLSAMMDIGVIHIDQFENDEEFDIPIGSGVDTSQDLDDYFFAGFSALERDLVKDHMIDGYSLQELSIRHKISKSRAGEIIRKLTERMRIRAQQYVENN